MSFTAYKGLIITDTTNSTSKSTGAVTCAGGIGVGQNVVSGGAIIADGTYPVKVYSTKPPNSGTTTSGGVLIMPDATQGGIVNISDNSIAMGVNVGSYFGTRDITKQGGMVRLNTASLDNPLDIIVQPASGIETTAFSVNTTGNVLCRTTTASTSTSTGALVCSGGMGVTGNVNVGGTLNANQISSNTTIKVLDGANEGTIDQVSTELTLSSSGNKVAIPSTHTLEFKNDGTSQFTAYTGRGVADDCDIHTFVYNSANPSTPRYMLSSTFALNQTVPTTFSISANIVYAFPVRLIKGQIVHGAGFYLSVSGSGQIGYAIYDNGNPSTRDAFSTLSNTPSNGMNYINFSSPYTSTYTGIHYVCILATNTGLSLIATNTGNTYINYGQSTTTSGVLNKAGQSFSSSSFPSSLSGVSMTILNRVGYAVVYTTNP
jgi:hypothetical protein